MHSKKCNPKIYEYLDGSKMTQCKEDGVALVINDVIRIKCS